MKLQITRGEICRLAGADSLYAPTICLCSTGAVSVHFSAKVFDAHVHCVRTARTQDTTLKRQN